MSNKLFGEIFENYHSYYNHIQPLMLNNQYNAVFTLLVFVLPAGCPPCNQLKYLLFGENINNSYNLWHQTTERLKLQLPMMVNKVLKSLLSYKSASTIESHFRLNGLHKHDSQSLANLVQYLSTNYDEKYMEILATIQYHVSFVLLLVNAKEERKLVNIHKISGVPSLKFIFESKRFGYNSEEVFNTSNVCRSAEHWNQLISASFELFIEGYCISILTEVLRHKL